jgi:uncharacterized cupin superfamily protein
LAVMTIDRDYFGSKADVMQDIAKTGYWPTTYVSGESPELPVHYHDYDIIGYVVEGSTYLLDEDENRVEIRAGDRLNLPKGSWHAEGAATDRVTYIVTVSEPVPIFQALMPREAKGPMPDFGS